MGIRYVIEDFNLYGGLHCETSALRKIFLYNNLSVSEEMLLGLAGGIGFIYWFTKGMPAPVIGGRGGGRYFIENIGQRTGSSIKSRRTTSSKKGHYWLLEKLANNQPSVIYADMAYLPYMGVPDDAHFGQHVFVVYGVDEDRDIVYISDRGERGVTVTVEQLKEARASKYPPWPPQHAIFDIKLPHKITVTPKNIRDALHQCVDVMLNPPLSNFGLKGFEKWANLVMKWPKLFPGMKLWDALYQGFIYIETGGTGGSAMRPMFARYLEEAKIILQKSSLDQVIAKYYESAKIWSKIAELYLPNEYPALARGREILWEQSHTGAAQKPGTTEKLHQLNDEIESMKDDIIEDLRKASVFLLAVKAQILKLYKVEKEAIHLLKKIIE